jgi:plasmid stabilization system protein ParE
MRMNSTEISAAARNDLRGIWFEIAIDSEINADRMINRLIDVCDILGQNPQLGALWSRQDSQIRYFPVPGNNYVIFFGPTSKRR